MKPSQSKSCRSWFNIENGDNVRTVTFLEDRKLCPKDLDAFPLPRDTWRHTRITGKSSVVAYAHVAAWAAQHGAPSIEVFQPNKEWISIHPLQPVPGGLALEPWVKLTKIPDDFAELEFQSSDTPNRWLPEVIGSLPHYFADLEKDSRISATGKGANWMYAATAVLATLRNLENYCHVVMFDQKAVRLGDISDNEQRLVELPKASSVPKKGIILGILGDPNSGKSVFSKLASSTLTRMSFASWSLDCDLASPTPDWFLYASKKEAERVCELRQSQKRKWTPELEKRGAEDLKACRSSYDILIADLPGGIHTGKFENNPQRIPKGREVLMEDVDYFLILTRPDTDAVDGWQRELNAVGMGKKVVAVVESLNPDAEQPTLEMSPPSDPGGLWSGWAIGLDRCAVRLPNTEKVRFREGLEPFAEWLVKFHGQNNTR